MEVDSVATPAVQQEDEDLYLRMKELQNKLEMIEIQEDYIKTELNHLKAEEIRSKEEVSSERSHRNLNELEISVTKFVSFFAADPTHPERAHANW